MLLGVLTVAILAFLLADIGFAFQNEPEGFRDLKWGDPPREDMVYIGTIEGGSRLYELPDEKLYLGDAQFYMILYSFYGSPERFMSVALHFQGKENYDLLERMCLARFGKQMKKEIYQISWLSPRTSVYLRYDFIEDRGTLSLDDWTIFSEFLRTREREEIEKEIASPEPFLFENVTLWEISRLRSGAILGTRLTGEVVNQSGVTYNSHAWFKVTLYNRAGEVLGWREFTTFEFRDGEKKRFKVFFNDVDSSDVGDWKIEFKRGS